MIRVGVLVLTIVTLCDSRVVAQPGPGETALYAMHSDGSSTWKLIPIKDYPSFCSPEISPDGLKVAADGWRAGENSVQAHILIVDLNDGNVKDLGIGCMPSWSADGAWIACSRYGQGVFLKSVEGTEEKLIDPAGWSIQWSSDGREVAYVRGNQIIVRNLSTDASRDVFPPQNLPYQQIAHNMTWSPDSKRICFLGYRADRKVELATVSVAGDDPQLQICGEATTILPDIGWHPDGSRIVVPDNKGRLRVFDPNGKSAPTELTGQPEGRANSGMSWSRDGKLLVFVSAK